MKHSFDISESDDPMSLEWPHIPRDMLARLRPIWEGYPNHPCRVARLSKFEKPVLLPTGLVEVEDHFSVQGAAWKKRRDEAMAALVNDQ